MKKQDLLIIVLLFALWISWPYVDRLIIKKFFPANQKPPAASQVSNAATNRVALPSDTALTEAPVKVEAEAPAPQQPAAVEPEPVRPLGPEQTTLLTNQDVEIKISSRGGAIVSALLKKYQQTATPDSGPVFLDFGASRPLAWMKVPAFSEDHDFKMTPAADGRSVKFEHTPAGGVSLVRTISLDDNYLLRVVDVLSNSNTNDLTLEAGLQMGAMSNLTGEVEDATVASLGVDTLSPGGEGVQYWAKNFGKWFKNVQEENQLTKLPVNIEWPLNRPVDWVAVKNRYFAQIMTPEGGADRCVVNLRREKDPREVKDPEFSPKMTGIDQVGATVYFTELVVPAGQSASRSLTYYIGPKQFAELNRFGMHQVEVMEFGFWRPVGKVLLVIMNWIHDHIWPHNYGLAIILLTVLVRIVFWPVTHKSTESMKKMQAIQPLIMEMRAKYKDNPQRQQQEMMALYKEHKVNPLGGCLPMLVQIPVFIALFVVLRSAIELRFSSFLWIKDLSAPENLLAGMLPFGLGLNILPILMAATMAWQQKLTPTGGDPQQQKIMMFMPVLMLVFFYNFASGLSLYWTTNQCLMIAQLLLQKRKQAKKQSVSSKQ
jgi:YidC/Oxa1 family membrane protein insertase